MVSPDGTTIPPPQGLIDAAGHVWTLVGGGVRVDGEWAGFAIADVAQLAIYRGVVYVQQVGGTWWWRAAATGSWRPVSTTSLKVQQKRDPAAFAIGNRTAIPAQTCAMRSLRRW